MSGHANPQETSQPHWVTIPLGVAGGLEEGNLSAYLLAPQDSTDFICLDAGTVYSGLLVAQQAGSFAKIAPENNQNVVGDVLRSHIKAYLISHAHLDHVAGLVINATDDISKPIMGLPAVLADIQNHLFNWRIFPNFGDVGVQPLLKKYHYIDLPTQEAVTIPQTGMHVTAFPLSHGNNYASTAFLIESGGFYALYLGDTGADSVENTTTLQQLWIKIAPLIKSQQLKGLFIESAYSNERPSKQLYGHLTPQLVIDTLTNLAQQVDSEHTENALREITVIITHIKPVLEAQVNIRETIRAQLSAANHLGIRFILAEQGQKIEF
ncbi:MBL fold metallo-hydrolase [Beggiatoa leptomitoformis]|uniref:3',5'-cyclic-nucleotide phosphodiesterase n=1 Tax=Beggiatoa leptomitoformis TaxID=288004 RepID=A0A2N9YJ10_9GAMM|nr:3',5'-cyclic-nucleotide phosphodiesterase [Beggiatoa leptomitoformis]ALG69315.1 3',5'-cyclic-nucleotide phosphodiesterase [Beggiatoa leptomitoformis]AUI70497.1 3',5'-cyclic-nucleotide phosphodiesterase [Beggiatoa leptomitoformis]